MFKKCFALFSVLIVTAMVLAACATPTTSESNQAPGATQAPATSEPVTINWWQLANNDTTIADFKEIIAAYEAAHPGVTINLETRSIDDQKTALRQAAGTDGFPDIYFMWSGLGLGGEFVDAGLSLPMDKYYTQYGWDTRLNPAAVAAAKQYGDGHLHGIMSEVHGQVIFYLKDAFQKAGITSIPTTYDELMAANDKLIAAGYSPIEFGGTVNWHVMRLLDNILETKCGAETHDQLKKMDASWATTPCVAEAFTDLKTWSEKYITPNFMAMDNNESTQLLYSGKAATALEGDWFNGQLVNDQQDTDNYGIFLFPTGTGRLYSFAQGNYVGANSKHPDVAADFLNYFNSDEVQQKYLGTWGAVSVAANVKATNPSALDAAWPPIFAAATGTFQNADQAFPLDITTEYWRIQNLVATGEMDPAQAGVEFQKFIDSHTK
jgi:raffinose/stachyose/melibiose transport system substrate-binding protein